MSPTPLLCPPLGYAPLFSHTFQNSSPLPSRLASFLPPSTFWHLADVRSEGGGGIISPLLSDVIGLGAHHSFSPSSLISGGGLLLFLWGVSGLSSVCVSLASVLSSQGVQKAGISLSDSLVRPSLPKAALVPTTSAWKPRCLMT